MQTFTKYRAFDGTEFDERADCLIHEKHVAHKRLVGLTIDEVEAALAGGEPELANAIELVGGRLARARIAEGILKRQPNGAATKQITHQPGDPAAEQMESAQ